MRNHPIEIRDMRTQSGACKERYAEPRITSTQSFLLAVKRDITLTTIWKHKFVGRWLCSFGRESKTRGKRSGARKTQLPVAGTFKGMRYLTQRILFFFGSPYSSIFKDTVLRSCSYSATPDAFLSLTSWKNSISYFILILMFSNRKNW